MPQPTCYLHPATEAQDTCSACLQPVCGVCLQLLQMRTYCPACAARARRRRSITRLSVVVALVAALGGGLFALRGAIGRAWTEATRKKAPERPDFDYGKYELAVQRMTNHLQREPCDRPMMLKLNETLYRAGDHRRVITDTEAFIARCGKFNRLRWTTYEAHKQLSEWKEALADATRLIADDPDDKDYRWWRGVVYEQLEQWDRAAADYQQAILLQPTLTRIPFNLARALEQLGRPCDAIFPLEQVLQQHPDLRNRDEVRARVDGYYRDPRCKGLVGSGQITLRRPRGQTVFTGQVRIGEGEGRFIIDTGASHVSLTRDFARRHGIDTSRSREVLLRTAGGVKRAHLVSLEQVQLLPSGAQAPLSARTVEAMVFTDDATPGPGIDGLLGLSFLSRFAVSLDDDRLVIGAR